jgi:hypothetical protein
LGVFEVISHRYSERKDVLVAQEQTTTQQRHDEEMARLKLQTARLDADAESAKRDIANANAEAAKANERAAQAELARAQLERKLAPRALDEAAQERIAANLKSFAPQEVKVSEVNGTEEADAFAASIVSALSKAGLKVTPVNLGGLILGPTLPPLSIQCTPDLFPLADAIAGELISEGAADRPVHMEELSKSGSEINLTISRKAFP